MRWGLLTELENDVRVLIPLPGDSSPEGRKTHRPAASKGLHENSPAIHRWAIAISTVESPGRGESPIAPSASKGLHENSPAIHRWAIAISTIESPGRGERPLAPAAPAEWSAANARFFRP